MPNFMHADGKVTLEEARAFVNGYVEVVRHLPGDNGILLVNEDGRFLNLPENESASQIAGQKIVGNAIYIPARFARNWR